MGSQSLGVIQSHDSLHGAGDVPVRLAAEVIRKWRRIDATLWGRPRGPGHFTIVSTIVSRSFKVSIFFEAALGLLPGMARFA